MKLKAGSGATGADPAEVLQNQGGLESQRRHTLDELMWGAEHDHNLLS